MFQKNILIPYFNKSIQDFENAIDKNKFIEKFTQRTQIMLMTRFDYPARKALKLIERFISEFFIL